MRYALKKIKIFLFGRKKQFTKRIVSKSNSITLSMIVHNEANRYLKTVLEHALKYVDKVIIIDDASTDNTVEVCENILKNTPHKIIKNKVSLFHKEHKLRTLQWNETLKMKPDWILFLDADDIFEDIMKFKSKELTSNPDVDVYKFRYFDMWNENEYREDEYWSAHYRYKPFLIRYQPKFKYKYLKWNHHCGRVPKDLDLLPNKNSDIRIKHMGWSKEIDRKNKFLRYQKMDPNAEFGISKQYESILDKTPNLIKF